MKDNYDRNTRTPYDECNECTEHHDYDECNECTEHHDYDECNECTEYYDYDEYNECTEHDENDECDECTEHHDYDECDECIEHHDYDECDECCEVVPRKWSDVPYAGEKLPPDPEEPTSGSWPTFFLKRNEKGEFVDECGKPIKFNIKDPHSGVDFEKQLCIVKKVFKNLTCKQIQIARYWADGPATKQWEPIIDILIDTYEITAPRAARILAAVNGALNDAFVVSWYLKFKWQVLRPNQLDQCFASLLCMPRHPSYPSGHATVAGCAEVVLSYFFKPETKKLHDLAEECAVSRLYGGVHFPIDNDEGLKLGRQIGYLVVEQLSKQYDSEHQKIDTEITEYKDAKLIPPPYKQAIPFDRDTTCKSLVLKDHYNPWF